MADSARPADSFVRLGDSGWEMWPDVVLRSAGFPAGDISRLSDPELAAASDALEAVSGGADGGGTGDAGASGAQESFAKEYHMAFDRVSAAIRQFAADPKMREAIAWQNRYLLDNCLDKAARGERRNARGRLHELTIAAYAQ